MNFNAEHRSRLAGFPTSFANDGVSVKSIALVVAAINIFAFSSSPVRAADENGGTRKAALNSVGSPPSTRAFEYSCKVPLSPDMATHCEALEANRLASEANQIALDTTKSERWSPILGAIAAFFSFISIIIAATALGDSRRSAEAAIKALDEGGALILPTHTRLTYKITKERDETISDFAVTGHIGWKNFGGRPALQVGFEGGVIMVPPGATPPRVPNVRLDDKWKSLAPGEEHKVDTRKLDDAVAWTLLSRPSGDLYLIGIVTYRDRLNPDRQLSEQITMLAEPFEIPDFEPGRTIQGGAALYRVTVKKPDSSFQGHLATWYANYKVKAEHTRMVRNVRKMTKLGLKSAVYVRLFLNFGGLSRMLISFGFRRAVPCFGTEPSV